MTTNLPAGTAPGQPPPPELLKRAMRAAQRAREHDAAGRRHDAERERRRALAFCLFFSILTDDARCPSQWLVEQMVSAHLATAAERAAA